MGEAKKKYDAEKVNEVLSEETVKFRDKLAATSGETLTVGDTRVALNALEDFMNGKAMLGILSPNQKKLLDLWIQGIKKLNDGSGEDDN